MATWYKYYGEDHSPIKLQREKDGKIKTASASEFSYDSLDDVSAMFFTKMGKPHVPVSVDKYFLDKYDFDNLTPEMVKEMYDNKEIFRILNDMKCLFMDEKEMIVNVLCSIRQKMGAEIGYCKVGNRYGLLGVDKDGIGYLSDRETAFINFLSAYFPEHFLAMEEQGVELNENNLLLEIRDILTEMSPEIETSPEGISAKNVYYFAVLINSSADVPREVISPKDIYPDCSYYEETKPEWRMVDDNIPLKRGLGALGYDICERLGEILNEYSNNQDISTVKELASLLEYQPENGKDREKITNYLLVEIEKYQGELNLIKESVNNRLLGEYIYEGISDAIGVNYEEIFVPFARNILESLVNVPELWVSDIVEVTEKLGKFAERLNEKHDLEGLKEGEMKDTEMANLYADIKDLMKKYGVEEINTIKPEKKNDKGKDAERG